MKRSRVEANRPEYKKLNIMTWAYSLIAAAAVAALIYTLWFTAIRISDNGMSPTLYSGDIILFDKLAPHMLMPSRGDAYAFESANGVSVGRVAGLPGDEITIKDGVVYIGGHRLDESAYVSECVWDMGPLTLGREEFLILPDDRAGIMPDAALMTVGRDRLIGRAAVRVAPMGMVCMFAAG